MSKAMRSAAGKERMRVRDRERKRIRYWSLTEEQRRAYNSRASERFRNRTSGQRERKRQTDREWQRLNREKCRQYTRKWLRANPDQIKVTNHKRRARMKAAEGSYTKQEWRELARKCDHRCLACGKQEPHVKLTPDHIVPLARGGTNFIGNIQPLCYSCNSRKQAKVIDYRERYA
jgi:5-methylcytosine-specific restriction endonuclease McrA